MKDTGKIRFGLLAVKNVGTGIIEAILSSRQEGKFTSIEDFCKRVDASQINKKVMEALIKSGQWMTLAIVMSCYSIWRRS
jgi:DNA polymerase-3 subunit alpha